MNPCDWPVISFGCDTAGDALGSVLEDGSIRILSAIAQGIASFAAMVLEGLWATIQRVTNPQTDADFLYQWAGMLFGVALPITVAFMVFQVIQSVLHARGLTRSGVFSAVTGAALAIFGTAASLPIVHYLTMAVDGVADAMTSVIVGDIDTLGEAFAGAVGGEGVSYDQLLTPLGQDRVIAEGTAGVLGGLIGMIILGFLMIVGAMAVFAALLIRTLLLYAVVVTGPIAFLGLVWSPVRPWFRRWVTAIVALIFTKLGVVIVFGLGISAMNGLEFDGGILEALGRLLSGTVLMLISAFVPIVAFKFFGFLGEQAVESLHAGAQTSVQRGGEVVGQLVPHRVMERVSGHSLNGSKSLDGHGSNGHGTATTPGQQVQPMAPLGQGGGSGTESPAQARASSGGTPPASGAGTVLVETGAAAAERVTASGRQAGHRVAAEDPFAYDPLRPPPSVGGSPGTPRQQR